MDQSPPLEDAPLEAFGPEGEAPLLYLTQRAHARLSALMEKRAPKETFLSIEVNAGGCAGFTYTLNLVDAPQEDQMILTCDGISLLLDDTSLDMLKGSTLDFATSLMGEAFSLKNPSATSSCGCGTSFSIF